MACAPAALLLVGGGQGQGQVAAVEPAGQALRAGGLQVDLGAAEGRQDDRLAARDDVRAGDYVIWETVENYDGITVTVRRQGIARRRNDYGDWFTEGGAWLTEVGFAGTLTIRRTVTSKESAL